MHGSVNQNYSTAVYLGFHWYYVSSKIYHILRFFKFHAQLPEMQTSWRNKILKNAFHTCVVIRRITTEAMCTLHSKDVCTTAHILGTCKVSLQQGRYIFTHHTVLCSVTEALKAFIVNIKEAVPVPAKSSIKFPKKRSNIVTEKDFSHWYFTSYIRLGSFSRS